jgi:large subunit ribosomal protein L5
MDKGIVMAKPRLHATYESSIKPKLKKTLGLTNDMEIPKLSKIVINVGVKDAVTNSKAIKAVMDVMRVITGQQPVRTLARKSIAGFKVREGMPIGVKVTL